jgi:hypothetical protein
MLLQKIIQLQLRGCPNRRLQTLPDRFAVNFDFPKVVSADNVLEQMRHFRKRAPLSIAGKMFLSLPGTRLFIP